MIYFQSDYVEGAHPKILEKLIETNYEQTSGYGEDRYCQSAREKIRYLCEKPDADVHFLVGGTQTNLTVVASALRPYQGVISAEEGHVACHETGAIEATGHKVITLPSSDGLLKAADIQRYIEDHFASPVAEHLVQPGMVYISFPTESGTLYSKKELSDIYAVCQKYSIPLYIDGARLGYGLMSEKCDLTLPDIASLCDVFYIGGTKCGALFGEAVVITSNALKRDFRYMMKQRGALLAKGRLLGIQFDTLMENNLYFDICSKAVSYALEIKHTFEDRGVKMFGSSETNQQFPILTQAQMDYFNENYVYEVWGPSTDGRTITRFCTSWATKEEDVKSLISHIKNMPD